MSKQDRQPTAVHTQRRQWLAAGVALLLCALPAQPANAGESQLEYQVKAAFLLNFLKFAEWPSDGAQSTQSNTPFTIGVLGNDPFGAVLDDTVRGKNIDGRAVQTLRCNTDEEAARCHIVFISKDERRELKPTVEKLVAKNVLVVGESNDILRAGGMIRFVVVDEKVKFDADQSNLDRARLKLSSKVLNLARQVFKKGNAQ